MAKDTKSYKIFSEVDDIKTNYETSSLEKVSGLKRSQYQVIKMCEYYSDSRYMGKTNENNKRNGVDIPFYNIVNYRVALAKTATDLDIKDIQIVADNPKYTVHSMLLNREAYEWMKLEEFSKTLNLMGQTRPKYGGYLVKKTEIKGKLNIDVVKWTNVWTDQNDILNNPIVEKHPMSPIALKNKQGVWDNVVDVLKLHQGMKAKDRPTTIDIYEATGEFPIAVYKDAVGEKVTEDDKYTYSMQRHFMAELDGKKFLLYSEELTGKMDDYYDYLSWEDNGYGLGRGVIEDSEEAQVWTNNAVVEESFAMKLAGRAGIITNSKKLGNSVLEHDHGKIYELGRDETAAGFNIVPAALGQYKTQMDMWKMQADNVTSSFNSITGEQPPSGTPYSQTALLNQVATKPFDYKREEWGIHLTKMFDKWVIPYLIKKIKKEHILVSEFTDEELDVIDESFSVYNANEQILDEVINKGNVISPIQQADLIEGYKRTVKKNGKKRFIKIPDNYFEDIECKVTVLTSGEQKNKAVILQSISELMKTYIASFNPTTGQFGAMEDPFLSKAFKEALELTGSGISPVSLGKAPSKQVPQVPQAPAAQPAPQAPQVPQMQQPVM